MGSLYEQYCDWIDWSIYDGLDYDEEEELQEEIQKKYGVRHILKEDAPPDAVKAWKEDCIRTREAREKGEIVD